MIVTKSYLVNRVITGFIPNVSASTRIAFLQSIFVHSVLKHRSSVDPDFEILLGSTTTYLDLPHSRTSLFNLSDETLLVIRVVDPLTCKCRKGNNAVSNRRQLLEIHLVVPTIGRLWTADYFTSNDFFT